ncbi:MAG: hypothetical protein AAF253_00800 [Pseudomonadota bacterium]
MSTRALLRRSREAKAWLLDAMVPLWSQASLERAGGVAAALDLNHRPLADDPGSDPLAAIRLAAAFARIRRLDPENSAIARSLEGFLGDTLGGPEASTLVARAGWLLAHGLSAGEVDASVAKPALPGAARAIIDAAHDQATRLVAGKAFKAAGLPTWLDACLVLARVDPTGGHTGRASSLAAALTNDIGSAPCQLFVRADEPVDIADQFNWSWRMAAHADSIGAAWPVESQALFAFAAAAQDEDGSVPKLVTQDGTKIDASLTLDAQAAALMAHLSQLRVDPAPQIGAAARDSFDAIMDTHLTPEGGWIANYTAEGLPADQQIAARHADTIARALVSLIDTMAA